MSTDSPAPFGGAGAEDGALPSRLAAPSSPAAAVLEVRWPPHAVTQPSHSVTPTLWLRVAVAGLLVSGCMQPRALFPYCV